MQTSQRHRTKPITKLLEHYKALRHRLEDALGRGERDYALLTRLAQDMVRLRRRLKQERAARTPMISH